MSTRRLSLTNNLTADQMKQLPIAQDYRDPISSCRRSRPTDAWSSAGERARVTYKFDGINVTLPLYGTLS